MSGFGAETDKILKGLIRGNPHGFFRIDKDEEKFIKDNFGNGGYVSVSGQKAFVYTDEYSRKFILDKERTPLQLFIIVKNVSTKIKQCMLLTYIADEEIRIPIIFPSEEAKWLFSGIMRAPDMCDAYNFLMKEKLNEELENTLSNDKKIDKKGLKI